MKTQSQHNHCVVLTHEILNTQQLTDLVEHPGAGAIVTFDGVVRDNSQHLAKLRNVAYLEYSAYEAMAWRELEKVWAQTQARWDVKCAIAHRLGRLEIGESSVLIAVSSAHRKVAFEACHWAIDEIKRTVPIWKKEVTTEGYWWVEDPTQSAPQVENSG